MRQPPANIPIATGQTGIMIAGSGMPIDAVVSDFVAGAAEMLSPDADPAHWDVIEGQGSLFHPSYAAVTLGLLHGSQPDVIVVCHQPGRTTMLGLPGFSLPAIEEVVEMTIALGRRTNPEIRCGGVSLNTSKLSEVDAQAMLEAETGRLGVPVADPVRGAWPRSNECSIHASVDIEVDPPKDSNTNRIDRSTALTCFVIDPIETKSTPV